MSSVQGEPQGNTDRSHAGEPKYENISCGTTVSGAESSDRACDKAIAAAEKSLEAAHRALADAENALAEAKRQVTRTVGQSEGPTQVAEGDTVYQTADTVEPQSVDTEGAQTTNENRSFSGAPSQQPSGSQWSAQATPQQPGYQQPFVQPHYAPPVVSRDHVAAGLLGIFLGFLGVHKFYLGYSTQGFIMLAIALIGGLFSFGLVLGIVWIIGLIEGIIYLVKSQSEFERIYVYNKREWF